MSANPKSSLPRLESSCALPWSVAGVRAGFLGRNGGVSRGEFASLNLAAWVGDDSAAVEENWRRVRAILAPGTSIAFARQVHGRNVHVVSAGAAGPNPDCDGLVTAAAGVTVSVFTADCVPVLMADAERGVVGAIHAGWRGTLADIAAAGVDAMEAAGARRGAISAALGPSIGACCFEVDRELADRFVREIPGVDRHVRAGRVGKAFLDLRGIVRDQLVRAALAPASIQSVGPCTRCASDRYFSRRAAGGAVTGLQLSFAGLAA